MFIIKLLGILFVCAMLLSMIILTVSAAAFLLVKVFKNIEDLDDTILHRKK